MCCYGARAVFRLAGPLLVRLAHGGVRDSGAYAVLLVASSASTTGTPIPHALHAETPLRYLLYGFEEPVLSKGDEHPFHPCGCTRITRSFRVCGCGHDGPWFVTHAGLTYPPVKGFSCRLSYVTGAYFHGALSQPRSVIRAFRRATPGLARFLTALSSRSFSCRVTFHPAKSCTKVVW